MRSLVTIHPTAIVDPGARIGDGATVGPYCVVGEHASLGDGVDLVSHVVVEGHTRIGARSTVYPFASLGHPPQHLKHDGTPGSLVLGADVTVREHVTMNPGMGGGETRVGDNCYLMVGSHVAHDCQVGNHVVFANNATIAGHCSVGDHAILGGLAAVHQFARIGPYAFIGGASGVENDVIPFGSALGNRAYLGGLNIVGLKRHGFEREAIHRLRQAYRLLFSNEGTLAERVDDVAEMFADDEHVQTIITFIRSGGDRALCTPRNGRAG